MRHAHDGRCSGRLRLKNELLVCDVVCDDCGEPVHTPQAVGEYRPPAETLKVDPVRRARAVLRWISWAESTYAHEQI